MQVGSYEMPEHRLTTAIKDIKIISNASPTKEPISSSDLGGFWGYKNYSTGIFYRRLNSVLAYGLLGQITKGKFQVTELGEQLAHPESPEIEIEGKQKAVLNVPLWSEIFKKYGKDVSQDAFWVQLKNITGIDPVKAKNLQNQIRRWYLEDMSYVLENLLKEGKQSGEGLRSRSNKTNQMLQVISFDQYEVSLPKGDLKKEWAKLKKYMDIKLEDYKYEEGSESEKSQETDINANDEFAE